MSIILWSATIPVLAIFTMFTAEMLLGQWSSGAVTASGTPPRIAIIMPAHNEARGIAAVIAAVRAVLPVGTRFLVVADNCTDDTAAQARSAGAEVIERHDPDQRGKGYALAFGQAHLQAQPPECVVIIDADCVPDAGAIAMIAAVACDSNRPVQARYLFATDTDATPMVQISNFAFLTKNFVRQRGMTRMGGPALLTGTGMAFPWTLFADAPLASGNIVEDLALGIYFSERGFTPLFAPSAIVWSDAASEADTIVQRRRWEHGFLATARGQALPLIGAAISTGQWPLGLLGLHLLVPPVALLVLIGIGLTLLLGLVGLLGRGFAPFLALGAMMSASLALTFLAWLRFGRTTLQTKTLLALPAYLLWKLPVYFGLFSARETEWVRTKRPDE